MILKDSRFTQSSFLPDVDVYALPFAQIPIHWEYLSPEEITRAERFKNPDAKWQFACTRSWLRVLLAEYLCCDPREIFFRFGPNGKPYLEGEQLRFNVSHTTGLGLVAISRSATIGIDLEQKRPIPEARNLVQRFFAPVEYEQFCQLPETEQALAFLRGWTRKESILKAVGHGISSLADCEVSLADCEEVPLYCLKGDRHVSQKWRIVSWEPTPHHIAALATEKVM
ncbi:MAG: 4'-phosphopantetheinyl transferase superfamily protein [Gemmataceae bacterium]|jgi:4'-phosphopantetheinyl transferase|nr:4'-phosphopantetheinyl transferase superfamily protein [Gemmataceae bacterium]